MNNSICSKSVPPHRNPPTSSSVCFVLSPLDPQTPELRGKAPPLHAKMVTTRALIHDFISILHTVCLHGYLISVLDSELGNILPPHGPLTSCSNKPHTCHRMSCSPLCFLGWFVQGPSDLAVHIPFGISSPCSSLGSPCLNGRGSVLIDSTGQDKLGSEWCLQGHSMDSSRPAGLGQGTLVLPESPPPTKGGSWYLVTQDFGFSSTIHCRVLHAPCSFAIHDRSAA